MSERVEPTKLLPPPQDYDGTAKRDGMWKLLKFNQSLKTMSDLFTTIPKLVNRDELLGVFGGAGDLVNSLPTQIFESVKRDESPTIRIMRDMARMAVSENNSKDETTVMVKGLVAFAVATCGAGKEWNDANDWLKENGSNLLSATNNLLSRKKKA